jgi:hypothetical protein
MNDIGFSVSPLPNDARRNGSFSSNRTASVQVNWSWGAEVLFHAAEFTGCTLFLIEM